MDREIGKPLRVLVSGAGVAGPVLAYWLHKAGAEVTVVERARELREEGQTVDVRVEGIEVLARMGVAEAAKARTTAEKGLEFADANGTRWGRFPQDGSDSFTGEIEIVRGTLAKLLYEAAKDKAEWRFGTRIADIRQDEKGVDVRLEGDDQGKRRRFDVALVCEGLFSTTRAKVFDEPVDGPVRRLGFYIAGFSMDWHPAFGSREQTQWSRWTNLPGRRQLLVRPLQDGRLSVYVGLYDGAGTRVRDGQFRMSVPAAEQKRFWEAVLREGDGGGLPRELLALLVERMHAADDFYVQEIGQARMPRWSRGRVALVGDTASCPTLFTGMGTTVALVQAYTLAAQLAQHGAGAGADGVSRAFDGYEHALRAWVERIQDLPPGAGSGITAPESALGIRVLLVLSWIAALVLRSGIVGAASLFFSTRKPLPLEPVSVFDEGKPASVSD